MNRENLIKTARAIALHEVPDLGFNMRVWYGGMVADRSGHGCRTSACGAGWTIAVHYGFGVLKRMSGIAVRENAKRLLDLTDDEANHLFHGTAAWPKDWGKVTPDETVNTYLYAAANGVVDWDAAQAIPPARPWEAAS